jgi:hypothetical protein
MEFGNQSAKALEPLRARRAFVPAVGDSTEKVMVADTRSVRNL